MRKVAWDRGPVHLGHHVKADGSQVPMWHDSEVGAIAYAIQKLIAKRSGSAPTAPDVSTPTGAASPALMGAKCPECGAHAMIRKDGCDYCTQCGHLGSCG
jgi:ribonucleoside-diphosphate reductase alpha chain